MERIPPQVDALFNTRMKTIDQVRRERLIMLRKEFGGAGKLAEQIGKSPSQVSQWLNASQYSDSGKGRNVSDESAREIEQKCGKEPGWMDSDPDKVDRAAVERLLDYFFSATESGQDFILDAAKAAERMRS